MSKASLIRHENTCAQQESEAVDDIPEAAAENTAQTPQEAPQKPFRPRVVVVGGATIWSRK